MAAFNSFYPQYHPNYYTQNPYMIPPQLQQGQQPAQAPAQPAQPNTQQGGFVRVQNENEARMYPVAPGTSVTFIDENGPFCYTKTMDFSQLDRPKFDKYRLVKVEEPQSAPHSGENPDNVKSPAYATRDEVEELRSSLGALEEKVSRLTAKKATKETEGNNE